MGLCQVVGYNTMLLDAAFPTVRSKEAGKPRWEHLQAEILVKQRLLSKGQFLAHGSHPESQGF